MPNVFGSHMVVQQEKPLAVWGWAQPNESITVEIGNESRKAQANERGEWKVELPAALPSIMAGLTQCIMLSLSMVVIAALVGADGLGVPVVRALNQVNTALGFEAGFVIVVVAIMLGFPTAFTLMGMGMIFAWLAYRSNNPDIAAGLYVTLLDRQGWSPEIAHLLGAALWRAGRLLNSVANAIMEVADAGIRETAALGLRHGRRAADHQRCHACDEREGTSELPRVRRGGLTRHADRDLGLLLRRNGAAPQS